MDWLTRSWLQAHTHMSMLTQGPRAPFTFHYFYVATETQIQWISVVMVVVEWGNIKIWGKRRRKLFGCWAPPWLLLPVFLDFLLKVLMKGAVQVWCDWEINDGGLGKLQKVLLIWMALIWNWWMNTNSIVMVSHLNPEFSMKGIPWGVF